MNNSKTSFRAREQLAKFLGIFSPHFSKPMGKFLGQMFFGVQASQDVLLSKIGRALDEDIPLKKTEDRLSRNLKNGGIEKGVHAAILNDGKQYVLEDTLVIIDPTDIQKPYAKKMPLLAKVYDGSRGCVGENLGYSSCMAVACKNGTRRIVPLNLRLWSSKADGYTSDNDEVQDMMRTIADATGGRGIYVYDRGGDGNTMFDFFIQEGLDFIVRLVGDRNLISWGSTSLATSLAGQCPMKYRDKVTLKSDNKEVDVQIEFGSMPVRLPKHPDVQLYMVVVKGFGKKPMMLLTTEVAVRSRKSIFRIVRAYVTRWRVEDSIRYIKQAYNLENLRLLDYQRLKNMAAIIAAVAYFAAAWLGKSVKLGALVEEITRISKRMFEVPEFFYYAIADGLYWLFTRHGGWRDTDMDKGRDCGKGDIRQMEFEFG